MVSPLRLSLPTLHVIEPAPHAALGALIATGGPAAGDRLVMVGRSDDEGVARALGLRVDAVVTPTLGVTSSAARRLASRLRSWTQAGWACEHVVPWSTGAFEACVRVDDLVNGNPALARVSDGRTLGVKFAEMVPRPVPLKGSGQSGNNLVRTVAIFADPAVGSELTPYVQVLSMADKAGVPLRVLIPRGCVDQARAMRLWGGCELTLGCELCEEPLWTRGFDIGLSIQPGSGADSTGRWAASFWAGACERSGLAFVSSESSESEARVGRAEAARALVDAIQSMEEADEK